MNDSEERLLYYAKLDLKIEIKMGYIPLKYLPELEKTFEEMSTFMKKKMEKRMKELKRIGIE